MRNPILLGLIGMTLFAGKAALAGSGPNSVVEQLANETVSRLEWGIEKFEGALIEMFATDPVTLETSAPPFFVTVSYVREDGRIVVEIGRTFALLSKDRAEAHCSEYIAQVRAMLRVDRIGRPAVEDASSLAVEFFHPMTAAQTPDIEFAQALDRRVTLRALVASPSSGVFSICTAGLTHSPIRRLE